VEHVAGKLLEKLGFRDLKVAKRGREHVIYTARKRMGIAEVRHAIRILRGGAEAGRRDVADVRRDLGHYGAQLGIVISAGDAGREARSEALAAGQLPVVLLCGEALAEAFAEAGVGCVPVVVPDVDEGFFTEAAEAAEREEAARRARREDRERRERREPGRREERARQDDERPAEDGAVEATTAAEPARAEGGPAILEVPAYRVVPEVDARAEEGPDDGTEEGAEGDEDDSDEDEAAEVSATGEAGAPQEGAPGERRRRRRRRRRRGGRGRGSREGGVSAEGAAPPAAGAPGDAPRDEAPRPAEAASPPPATDGGEGGAP
jgi:hypothetical protein